MTPDTMALSAMLQAQATVLSRVSADLRIAVAHPPVAPHDWHGPASLGYDGLLGQLRSRLAVADEAVAAALGSTRLAVAQLEVQTGG